MGYQSIKKSASNVTKSEIILSKVHLAFV